MIIIKTIGLIAGIIGLSCFVLYIIHLYCLTEAENPYSPLACPAIGSFIGWKCAVDVSNHFALIKLEIPEDAKRTSGFGSKNVDVIKLKY